MTRRRAGTTGSRSQGAVGGGDGSVGQTDSEVTVTPCDPSNIENFQWGNVSQIVDHLLCCLDSPNPTAQTRLSHFFLSFHDIIPPRSLFHEIGLRFSQGVKEDKDCETEEGSGEKRRASCDATPDVLGVGGESANHPIWPIRIASVLFVLQQRFHVNTRYVNSKRSPRDQNH
mmetsp:Transcript_12633/g.19359  ORF Transcript_12633/g.19359 Transcript_12633/m.19359 type:complete len:172 (-) Transcript_12633:33-548(-)